MSTTFNNLCYNRGMATVEHELLRFFAEKGEATARDAIDAFGADRGITRGSVVKMIDRLIKKGLLQRRVVDHVFVYSPVGAIEEIEAGYVRDFVQSRLKGSLTPLLTFLSENATLKPEEHDAVQQIAERLEKKE